MAFVFWPSWRSIAGAVWPLAGVELDRAQMGVLSTDKEPRQP